MALAKTIIRYSYTPYSKYLRGTRGCGTGGSLSGVCGGGLPFRVLRLMDVKYRMFSACARMMLVFRV